MARCRSKGMEGDGRNARTRRTRLSHSAARRAGLLESDNLRHSPAPIRPGKRRLARKVGVVGAPSVMCSFLTGLALPVALFC